MDDAIIGEIRLAAFDEIPPGWAACDGQLLSISDHRALFQVLGANYGGDGRRTFALPDLTGRVALHADGSDYVIGAAGGSARHALRTGELPGHSHSIAVSSVGSDDGRADPSSIGVAANLSGDIVDWVKGGSATRADGHENMQPYLGLTFMIALIGRDPAGS